MSKKPESRLQRRIRAALQSHFGGWWVKIHVSEYQNAGTPDLIGCAEGLFFGIEVKIPGEEPSVIQRLTMSDIRKAGGVSCVVTSVEEALRVVGDAIVDVYTLPAAERSRIASLAAQRLRVVFGDGMRQDADLLGHPVASSQKGAGISRIAGRAHLADRSVEKSNHKVAPRRRNRARPSRTRKR